ncbi:hypothetical protein AAFF_G00330020 [Aldrovandia affinis]|uniref:Uncharacterized protein n=1 Tax=Aldrovandia affinis TaxID=143900 RepID=A0AAD7SNZ5_9TELE|nr:hypothetical protein AAFF_G00330020 [Aldrovandia affinis]
MLTFPYRMDGSDPSPFAVGSSWRCDGPRVPRPVQSRRKAPLFFVSLSRKVTVTDGGIRVNSEMPRPSGLKAALRRACDYKLARVIVRSTICMSGTRRIEWYLVVFLSI